MTRVAVIGPGRVGTALALALPRPTYEASAVAGRGQLALDAFTARLPEAVEHDVALSRLALRYARLAGLGDEAADTVAAVLDDQ